MGGDSPLSLWETGAILEAVNNISVFSDSKTFV